MVAAALTGAVKKRRRAFSRGRFFAWHLALCAAVVTPHKPVLLVLAGPNGSGKTTVGRDLRTHWWSDNCRYVNPDDIAQEIFGGWDNENNLKAAVAAEKMRQDYLHSGQSMAFETVFSKEDKLDFILAAKRAGFFIRFFFVCTKDPAINKKRVDIRVQEGGHPVPEDKIHARYHRAVKLAQKAAVAVQRAYFYDNSADNSEARLLFRTINGKVAKQYDGFDEQSFLWVRDIYRKCRKGK